MKSFSTRVTVEWEDCDPAGIVYYPKFYSFFDRGSWNIFHAVGLSHEVMQRDFGAIGIPVVETQASFRYPCRFKDELIVESTIAEVTHRSFVISHTIYNGGILAVEGREIRVWGCPNPEDPKRLKAAAIPEEVSTRFRD